MRLLICLAAAAGQELESSARAKQILGLEAVEGSVEGLQCHGSYSERYCPESTAQQVIAWMHLASEHHQQQLGSLEVAMKNALDLLSVLPEGCHEAQEAVLVSYAGALKAMVQHAYDMISIVLHLLIAGLCRFCYSLDEEGIERLQESVALSRFSGFLSKFERLQEEVWKSVRSVAEVERRCIPAYLLELIPGLQVGDSSELVAAVERLSQWPLVRRLRRPSQDRVHEDFYELGERLFGAILLAPGRLGHQLNILCLAMEQGRWPLLWRDLHGPPPLELKGPEPPAPAPGPHGRQGNESFEEQDPEAAFGLVVLVSNQTASETIHELMQRFEGPRCLFLEDTCGSSLDALGYNCHSSQEEQRSCLHPSHVANLIRSKELAWPQHAPHLAWRRHSGTGGVAQAARALGDSLWGYESSIWLMDFRPEALCANQRPLAEQLPKLRMKLVKKPEVLLDMAPSTVLPLRPLVEASSPRWPRGAPLAVRLAEYRAMHRRAVREGLQSGQRVLVYSCQPFAQCGGHGDRLNGIITVFLLAVLSNRVFLIDSESPLPLQLLLEPRELDWRVSGGLRASAALRHFSYHDKRQQFEADLEKLASYPEQLMVINMNYRMIRSLFEAPSLREAALELGLPHQAPPFLAAEIFDLLFAPSDLLRSELQRLQEELALESFIAIHLRTGEIAYDPSRHRAEDLQLFLDCARRAEEDVGEMVWLLATDSKSLAEEAMQLPEARSGKLRLPNARGRVHIDRSELPETLRGLLANYAEWLLFGRAKAVVLSRSYFGETAAELGRQRHAYFAPGGCVRTELSSS